MGGFIAETDNELRIKIVKNKGTTNEKALDVTVQTGFGIDVVRINIDDDSDNMTSRFHIPWDLKYTGPNVTSAKVLDYITFAGQGQPFFLEVHSATNNKNVYFRIDSNSLLFGPGYIELNTKINSNQQLYGLGERVSPNLFLGEGIYTSWSRDIPSPVEDGKPQGKNDYGVHPVYYTKAVFENASDPSYYAVYDHNAGA